MAMSVGVDHTKTPGDLGTVGKMAGHRLRLRSFGSGWAKVEWVISAGCSTTSSSASTKG
jgi:hypothetical protein